MKQGIVILQARLGSSRLPGKVLLPVNGEPMIWWQIQRIRKASVGPIVVATSTNKNDDVLTHYLESKDIQVIRGPLDNVVDRFELALKRIKCDYFVRLTGDCPLVMPDLLSEMNSIFVSSDYDYLSNTITPSFPDGLDAEFVNVEAFRKMANMQLSPAQKEHVTMAIYQNSSAFKIMNYQNSIDLSKSRWTVDYREDFEFISEVFAKFIGRELDITMNEILDAVKNGRISDNRISHSFRNIALTRTEGVDDGEV